MTPRFGAVGVPLFVSDTAYFLPPRVIKKLALPEIKAERNAKAVLMLFMGCILYGSNLYGDRPGGSGGYALNADDIGGKNRSKGDARDYLDRKGP
jgi:hypothetical protein